MSEQRKISGIALLRKVMETEHLYQKTKRGRTMKLVEKAIAYQRKQSANIKNNETEITVNNRKMLNTMLMIGCFTFGTVFVLSFFLESYQMLTHLYGFVVCFLMGQLFCTKHFLKNINPVYLIYTGYGVMVAYSIYASAYVTPNDTCVIILFLLFQLPIIIVDKSWRVNLIECVCSLSYLFLAVPLKKRGLFVDEALNCVLFTGVAIILGEYMRNIKIDNFELNRQATIREKFDYLTGLGNRRSLFACLEQISCQEDIAVIMLDVDNFKLYNDSYGHQKGDECLQQLSSLFREFGKRNHAVFFRYGGEEFVGIVHDSHAVNLLELCKRLNQSVYELKIPHKAVETHVLTVSIGVSAYEPHNAVDYKKLLSQADNALYCAKANGRNTSIKYEVSRNGI